MTGKIWTYLADLNADERNKLLTVRTEDGNVFEIVCRMAADKGGWLEKAGFSPGDKITVKCQQGQLIITKDETRADLEK